MKYLIMSFLSDRFLWYTLWEIGKGAKPFGMQSSTLKWVLVLARRICLWFFTFGPRVIAPRQRMMRRVRLQEEPVPWYGFEPPSLSVAKPLHHTREPKVGSGVGVRPEFNGRGGRSGEGSVSFGYPPGRYCQWAGFVPEEVVRLAQKGRVSDDRGL
jgi:hypothetical protein